MDGLREQHGGLRTRVALRMAEVDSGKDPSRVGQRSLTTGWAKSAAVGITLYGGNINEGSGVQRASNLVRANPFGSARRGAVIWCH